MIHLKLQSCEMTLTKNIITCMKLYHSYDHSFHEMLHSHALNDILISQIATLGYTIIHSGIIKWFSFQHEPDVDAISLANALNS